MNSLQIVSWWSFELRGQFTYAGFEARRCGLSVRPVWASNGSIHDFGPSGRPEVSARRSALVAASSSCVPSKSAKLGKRSRAGVGPSGCRWPDQYGRTRSTRANPAPSRLGARQRCQHKRSRYDRRNDKPMARPAEWETRRLHPSRRTA